MKKMIIIFGCLICLIIIIFVFSSRKPMMIINPQGYPELSLSARPDWAQWRAEGKGIAKFFRHFFAYKEKSENMVLNAFPEQNAFFAAQKQMLAHLPQPPKSQTYVRIAFVGDLMEVPTINERFIAPEILTELQSMDFVLGNLETPVSQSSTISEFRNSLSQFNVPPNYLNALVMNGKSAFQFLSLANNHILDRGDLGVQETIQNVTAKNILVHGADQKKFVLFSTKGIRVGISAATWGVNPQAFQGKVTSPIWYLKGIAPLDKNHIDLSQLKDSLVEMKKAGVDFKILFLHWGFEFETYPDPIIQEVGRELILAGADLIIGSHPHVLQPFELVQAPDHQGLIAYSMGNFPAYPVAVQC